MGLRNETFAGMHGDKGGGNARHVILVGHPDNLHSVSDTGLLEQINRDPEALAAELARLGNGGPQHAGF